MSNVKFHMKQLVPLAPPPGWGGDEVSNFLEVAQRNAFGSFVNFRAPFEKVIAIDAIYRRLINNLDNTRDWFAAFFVLRAHSSFLAASRLAVSGQIPEAYMVLRGTIENAFYGFYIAAQPKLRETWLRRHDDAASMRKVKQVFQIGKILEQLKLANARIHDNAKALYECTIDSGAHPNERALMQVLKINHSADRINFEVRYLTSGKEPAFDACLKTTTQIGVCALDIFQIAFPNIFETHELIRELDDLKKDM